MYSPPACSSGNIIERSSHGSNTSENIDLSILNESNKQEYMLSEEDISNELFDKHCLDTATNNRPNINDNVREINFRDSFVYTGTNQPRSNHWLKTYSGKKKPLNKVLPSALKNQQAQQKVVCKTEIVVTNKNDTQQSNVNCTQLTSKLPPFNRRVKIVFPSNCVNKPKILDTRGNLITSPPSVLCAEINLLKDFPSMLPPLSSKPINAVSSNSISSDVSKSRNMSEESNIITKEPIVANNCIKKMTELKRPKTDQCIKTENDVDDKVSLIESSIVPPKFVFTVNNEKKYVPSNEAKLCLLTTESKEEKKTNSETMEPIVEKTEALRITIASIHKQEIKNDFNHPLNEHQNIKNNLMNQNVRHPTKNGNFNTITPDLVQNIEVLTHPKLPEIELPTKKGASRSKYNERTHQDNYDLLNQPKSHWPINETNSVDKYLVKSDSMKEDFDPQKVQPEDAEMIERKRIETRKNELINEKKSESKYVEDFTVSQKALTEEMKTNQCVMQSEKTNSEYYTKSKTNIIIDEKSIFPDKNIIENFKQNTKIVRRKNIQERIENVEGNSNPTINKSEIGSKINSSSDRPNITKISPRHLIQEKHIESNEMETHEEQMKILKEINKKNEIGSNSATKNLSSSMIEIEILSTEKLNRIHRNNKKVNQSNLEVDNCINELFIERQDVQQEHSTTNLFIQEKRHCKQNKKIATPDGGQVKLLNSQNQSQKRPVKNNLEKSEKIEHPMKEKGNQETEFIFKITKKKSGIDETTELKPYQIDCDQIYSRKHSIIEQKKANTKRHLNSLVEELPCKEHVKKERNEQSEIEKKNYKSEGNLKEIKYKKENNKEKMDSRKQKNQPDKPKQIKEKTRCLNAPNIQDIKQHETVSCPNLTLSKLHFENEKCINNCPITVKFNPTETLLSDRNISSYSKANPLSPDRELQSILEGNETLQINQQDKLENKTSLRKKEVKYIERAEQYEKTPDILESINKKTLLDIHEENTSRHESKSKRNLTVQNSESIDEIQKFLDESKPSLVYLSTRKSGDLITFKTDGQTNKRDNNVKYQNASVFQDRWLNQTESLAHEHDTESKRIIRKKSKSSKTPITHENITEANIGSDFDIMPETTTQANYFEKLIDTTVSTYKICKIDHISGSGTVTDTIKVTVPENFREANISTESNTKIDYLSNIVTVPNNVTEDSKTNVACLNVAIPVSIRRTNIPLETTIQSEVDHKLVTTPEKVTESNIVAIPKNDAEGKRILKKIKKTNIPPEIVIIHQNFEEIRKQIPPENDMNADSCSGILPIPENNTKINKTPLIVMETRVSSQIITETSDDSQNLKENYVRSANISKTNVSSESTTETNVKSENTLETDISSENVIEKNVGSEHFTEIYNGSANITETIFGENNIISENVTNANLKSEINSETNFNSENVNESYFSSTNITKTNVSSSKSTTETNIGSENFTETHIGSEYDINCKFKFEITSKANISENVSKTYFSSANIEETINSFENDTNCNFNSEIISKANSNSENLTETYVNTAKPTETNFTSGSTMKPNLDSKNVTETNISTENVPKTNVGSEIVLENNVSFEKVSFSKKFRETNILPEITTKVDPCSEIVTLPESATILTVLDSFIEANNTPLENVTKTIVVGSEIVPETDFYSENAVVTQNISGTDVSSENLTETCNSHANITETNLNSKIAQKPNGRSENFSKTNVRSENVLEIVSSENISLHKISGENYILPEILTKVNVCSEIGTVPVNVSETFVSSTILTVRDNFIKANTLLENLTITDACSDMLAIPDNITHNNLENTSETSVGSENVSQTTFSFGNATDTENISETDVISEKLAEKYNSYANITETNISSGSITKTNFSSKHVPETNFVSETNVVIPENFRKSNILAKITTNVDGCSEILTNPVNVSDSFVSSAIFNVSECSRKSNIHLNNINKTDASPEMLAIPDNITQNNLEKTLEANFLTENYTKTEDISETVTVPDKATESNVTSKNVSGLTNLKAINKTNDICSKIDATSGDLTIPDAFVAAASILSALPENVPEINVSYINPNKPVQFRENNVPLENFTKNTYDQGITEINISPRILAKADTTESNLTLENLTNSNVETEIVTNIEEISGSVMFPENGVERYICPENVTFSENFRKTKSELVNISEKTTETNINFESKALPNYVEEKNIVPKNGIEININSEVAIAKNTLECNLTKTNVETKTVTHIEDISGHGVSSQNVTKTDISSANVTDPINFKDSEKLNLIRESYTQPSNIVLKTKTLSQICTNTSPTNISENDTNLQFLKERNEPTSPENLTEFNLVNATEISIETESVIQIERNIGPVILSDCIENNAKNATVPKKIRGTNIIDENVIQIHASPNIATISGTVTETSKNITKKKSNLTENHINIENEKIKRISGFINSDINPTFGNITKSNVLFEAETITKNAMESNVGYENFTFTNSSKETNALTESFNPNDASSEIVAISKNATETNVTIPEKIRKTSTPLQCFNETIYGSEVLENVIENNVSLQDVAKIPIMSNISANTESTTLKNVTKTNLGTDIVTKIIDFTDILKNNIRSKILENNIESNATEVCTKNFTSLDNSTAPQTNTENVSETNNTCCENVTSAEKFRKTNEILEYVTEPDANYDFISENFTKGNVAVESKTQSNVGNEKTGIDIISGTETISENVTKTSVTIGNIEKTNARCETETFSRNVTEIEADPKTVTVEKSKAINQKIGLLPMRSKSMIKKLCPRSKKKYNFSMSKNESSSPEMISDKQKHVNTENITTMNSEIPTVSDNLEKAHAILKNLTKSSVIIQSLTQSSDISELGIISKNIGKTHARPEFEKKTSQLLSPENRTCMQNICKPITSSENINEIDVSQYLTETNLSVAKVTETDNCIGTSARLTEIFENVTGILPEINDNLQYDTEYKITSENITEISHQHNGPPTIHHNVAAENIIAGNFEDQIFSKMCDIPITMTTPEVVSEDQIIPPTKINVINEKINNTSVHHECFGEADNISTALPNETKGKTVSPKIPNFELNKPLKRKLCPKSKKCLVFSGNENKNKKYLKIASNPDHLDDLQIISESNCSSTNSQTSSKSDLVTDNQDIKYPLPYDEKTVCSIKHLETYGIQDCFVNLDVIEFEGSSVTGKSLENFDHNTGRIINYFPERTTSHNRSNVKAKKSFSKSIKEEHDFFTVISLRNNKDIIKCLKYGGESENSEECDDYSISSDRNPSDNSDSESKHSETDTNGEDINISDMKSVQVMLDPIDHLLIWDSSIKLNEGIRQNLYCKDEPEQFLRSNKLSKSHVLSHNTNLNDEEKNNCTVPTCFQGNTDIKKEEESNSKLVLRKMCPKSKKSPLGKFEGISNTPIKVQPNNPHIIQMPQELEEKQRARNKEIEILLNIKGNGPIKNMLNVKIKKSNSVVSENTMTASEPVNSDDLQIIYESTGSSTNVTKNPDLGIPQNIPENPIMIKNEFENLNDISESVTKVMKLNPQSKNTISEIRKIDIKTNQSNKEVSTSLNINVSSQKSSQKQSTNMDVKKIPVFAQPSLAIKPTPRKIIEFTSRMNKISTIKKSATNLSQSLGSSSMVNDFEKEFFKYVQNSPVSSKSLNSGSIVSYSKKNIEQFKCTSKSTNKTETAKEVLNKSIKTNNLGTQITGFERNIKVIDKEKLGGSNNIKTKNKSSTSKNDPLSKVKKIIPYRTSNALTSSTANISRIFPYDAKSVQPKPKRVTLEYLETVKKTFVIDQRSIKNSHCKTGISNSSNTCTQSETINLTKVLDGVNKVVDCNEQCKTESTSSSNISSKKNFDPKCTLSDIKKVTGVEYLEKNDLETNEKRLYFSSNQKKDKLPKTNCNTSNNGIFDSFDKNLQDSYRTVVPSNLLNNQQSKPEHSNESNLPKITMNDYCEEKSDSSSQNLCSSLDTSVQLDISDPMIPENFSYEETALEDLDLFPANVIDYNSQLFENTSSSSQLISQGVSKIVRSNSTLPITSSELLCSVSNNCVLSKKKDTSPSKGNKSDEINSNSLLSSESGLYFVASNSVINSTAPNVSSSFLVSSPSTSIVTYNLCETPLNSISTSSCSSAKNNALEPNPTRSSSHIYSTPSNDISITSPNVVSELSPHKHSAVSSNIPVPYSTIASSITFENISENSDPEKSMNIIDNPLLSHASKTNDINNCAKYPSQTCAFSKEELHESISLCITNPNSENIDEQIPGSLSSRQKTVISPQKPRKRKSPNASFDTYAAVIDSVVFNYTNDANIVFENKPYIESNIKVNEMQSKPLPPIQCLNSHLPIFQLPNSSYIGPGTTSEMFIGQSDFNTQSSPSNMSIVHNDTQSDVICNFSPYSSQASIINSEENDQVTSINKSEEPYLLDGNYVGAELQALTDWVWEEYLKIPKDSEAGFPVDNLLVKKTASSSIETISSELEASCEANKQNSLLLSLPSTSTQCSVQSNLDALTSKSPTPSFQEDMKNKSPQHTESTACMEEAVKINRVYEILDTKSKQNAIWNQLGLLKVRSLPSNVCQYRRSHNRVTYPTATVNKNVSTSSTSSTTQSFKQRGKRKSEEKSTTEHKKMKVELTSSKDFYSTDFNKTIDEIVDQLSDDVNRGEKISRLIHDDRINKEKPCSIEIKKSLNSTAQPLQQKEKLKSGEKNITEHKNRNVEHTSSTDSIRKSDEIVALVSQKVKIEETSKILHYNQTSKDIHVTNICRTENPTQTEKPFEKELVLNSKLDIETTVKEIGGNHENNIIPIKNHLHMKYRMLQIENEQPCSDKPKPNLTISLIPCGRLANSETRHPNTQSDQTMLKKNYLDSKHKTDQTYGSKRPSDVKKHDMNSIIEQQLQTVKRFCSEKSWKNHALTINKRLNVETQTKKNRVFQTGDFCIKNQDLFKLCPPLWRLDVEQKKIDEFVYANIDEEGKGKYNYMFKQKSSIGNFLSEDTNLWIKIYFSVNSTGIRFDQIKNEQVLEKFVLQRSFTGSLSFKYTFSTYVQVIISQAMNSDFIPYILHNSKDCNFFHRPWVEINAILKRYMKTINRCFLLYDEHIIDALIRYPSCALVEVEHIVIQDNNTCPLCGSSMCKFKIVLTGPIYDRKNLNSLDNNEDRKETYVCKECGELCVLFSKIVHFNYSVYQLALKHVKAQSSLTDPSTKKKDSNSTTKACNESTQTKENRVDSTTGNMNNETNEPGGKSSAQNVPLKKSLLADSKFYSHLFSYFQSVLSYIDYCEYFNLSGPYIFRRRLKHIPDDFIVNVSYDTPDDSQKEVQKE